MLVARHRSILGRWRSAAFACLCCGLGGCIGQAIETTTDVAIAVAKVPFKVGGAVVDVVTDDDDKSDKDDKDDN